MMQTPGDCQKNVCNGSGGTIVALLGVALAAVAIVGWLLNTLGAASFWTLAFVPSFCLAIVFVMAGGGGPGLPQS